MNNKSVTPSATVTPPTSAAPSMLSPAATPPAYPWAEEIANSISHGIGVVFGIIGLVLLLVQAVDSGADTKALTSYSLYGGSIILLFLASTLYHAVPHRKAKLWLQKFDHCAIYILIAVYLGRY